MENTDAYQIDLSVTLPASEEQLDGIVRLLETIQSGETSLLVRVSNYRDFDDFMAVYLERREERWHVELDFPMDDFHWKYPLVLACDLSLGKTRQLLRSLLVDASGSGNNDLVYRHFRQVSAVRYGEKEPKLYSKD